MLDRYNESFSLYPHIPTILAAARARGITMSVASRTHAPDLASQVLRGIYIPPLSDQQLNPDSTPESNGISHYGSQQGPKLSPTELLSQEKQTAPMKTIQYFTAPQMYPGSKITHFMKIQEWTQRQGKDKEVAFADMLFFDDESRNKDVERELGVTFVLVRDGVTVEEVDKGVREWRRRRGGCCWCEGTGAGLKWSLLTELHFWSMYSIGVRRPLTFGFGVGDDRN